MHVKVIKMRWMTGGVNYSYLLSTQDKTKSYLIDPAEPLEVIPALKTEEANTIEAVVNTHHHYDQLRMDPKVSKCQHVMTAWRIRGEGSVTYQDCEDDGETAAGGRLLHLLTLMDAWDVVVGVARWFTGTHIGPDRFKHINSTAREAVLRGSFADASKAGKKKK